MNLEQQLELQAYLDGELPGHDAQRVAGWLAKEESAQSLLAELRMAKTALTSNEPERAVPESREFYWSKIERALARPEPAQAKPTPTWLLTWRKYLMPAAGVAVVALLAVSTARFSNLTGLDELTRHFAEVENLSEQFSSYSFRSHAENMFVVWVHDRNLDDAAEPEPENEDDFIIQ
jgi:anti-sigma factor RsiW